MTSTAANNLAAMAAAMKGIEDNTSGGSMLPNRRSLPMRATNPSQSTDQGGESRFGNENDTDGGMDDDEGLSNAENAVADDFMIHDAGDSASKPGRRRASEGSNLKSEGKRSSGELRCDKCGKGYKHSSCLTKHLSVFPISFTRWKSNHNVVSKIGVVAELEVSFRPMVRLSKMSVNMWYTQLGTHS